MHAHESHEIYFFISGKGSFHVEGNIYPLEPGHLLIMRSGETHMLQISPDKPYERITLNFTPKSIESLDPEQKLLQAFCDRPIGRYNLYDHHQIRSGYIHECLKEMMCSAENNYIKRLSIISNLFPILLEINNKFLNIQQKKFTYRHNDSIREIILYINNNIRSDLSLEKLSAYFYISKSYLNRKFKQSTGSTVWEYITIKRLLLSREQILNNQPATRVSQRYGFKDYSSFYRAYKKYFSVSPQEDYKNSQHYLQNH
jgi:AraC-like DNA-binding protein